MESIIPLRSRYKGVEAIAKWMLAWFAKWKSMDVENGILGITRVVYYSDDGG